MFHSSQDSSAPTLVAIVSPFLLLHCIPIVGYIKICPLYSWWAPVLFTMFLFYFKYHCPDHLVCVPWYLAGNSLQYMSSGRTSELWSLYVFNCAECWWYISAYLCVLFLAPFLCFLFNFPFSWMHLNLYFNVYFQFVILSLCINNP